MKVKIDTCCDYVPEVELNYDLDECSIKCYHCGRSVVKRQLAECIRAWNVEKDGKETTIYP